MLSWNFAMNITNIIMQQTWAGNVCFMYISFIPWWQKSRHWMWETGINGNKTFIWKTTGSVCTTSRSSWWLVSTTEFKTLIWHYIGAHVSIFMSYSFCSDQHRFSWSIVGNCRQERRSWVKAQEESSSVFGTKNNAAQHQSPGFKLHLAMRWSIKTSMLEQEVTTSTFGTSEGARSTILP